MKKAVAVAVDVINRVSSVLFDPPVEISETGLPFLFGPLLFDFSLLCILASRLLVLFSEFFVSRRAVRTSLELKSERRPTLRLGLRPVRQTPITLVCGLG